MSCDADPTYVTVPEPALKDPLVRVKSALMIRLPGPLHEIAAVPDWIRDPTTVVDPEPMFKLIACPFVPSLRTRAPPMVRFRAPTSIVWDAFAAHDPMVF